jgi:RND family efflux transporter MFP subunit
MSRFACPSATIAIAFMGAALLSGCTAKNEYQPPPPPEVTVAVPLKQPVRDYLEVTGKTQSVESVDIRARVSGYLKSIEFRDGQTVEKDALLFVIEPDPFQVALASAKADFKKAEAKLSLAKTDVKRSEPLVKRGAMSEQEWDVIVANEATAGADVAAASAAVDQAQLNLSYTEVRAPIAGRISKHMVDVGNLVQTQTTVLTNIQTYAPIHAEFHLSENELETHDELRASEMGQMPMLGMEVRLGVAQGGTFPYEGKVDFAELGLDPNTGKQLCRAVFENKDGSLLPGLFVRIRIPVGDETPQLLVADRSIATDQRGDYVLVVNDKNIVEYRPVELGLTIEGLRVVKKGIKEGEWIVTNGIQRARPGGTVKPVQSTVTAARGAPSTGKLVLTPPPPANSPAETASQKSQDARSASRATNPAGG